MTSLQTSPAQTPHVVRRAWKTCIVAALMLALQGCGDSDSAPPPPAGPTITISANPASVASGGSSTLTWSSSGATSCTASDGWTGARATSGTYSTGALSSSTTYTLACTGADGTTSTSATVSVSTGGGTIYGLEWDGNETTNTQRVLAFNGAGGSSAPFPMLDSTYIFRVYPKGPKSASINPSYWTTFFWGNYGSFNPSHNYVGAHPYPFNGNRRTDGQNWELSLLANDYPQAGMDGTTHEARGYWTPDNNSANGSAQATWNRWYTQVVRVFRVDAQTVRHQFIWDWDLFVSSNGAQGWFQKTVNSSTWGTSGNNPPSPSIVIGEAPPNNANTASWGDYGGREQFKGIIRGIQLYDARLGANVRVPTVADLADVASELNSPGTVRTPWYLNLNPTPTDVTDKSGSGHHPWFPSGNKPTLWQG